MRCHLTGYTQVPNGNARDRHCPTDEIAYLDASRTRRRDIFEHEVAEFAHHARILVVASIGLIYVE